MAEPPKLQVDCLNESQAKYIVECIRDILWPQGKEDEPWSPDTIDAIASVMDEYHLRP